MKTQKLFGMLKVSRRLIHLFLIGFPFALFFTALFWNTDIDFASFPVWQQTLSQTWLDAFGNWISGFVDWFIGYPAVIAASTLFAYVINFFLEDRQRVWFGAYFDRLDIIAGTLGGPLAGIFFLIFGKKENDPWILWSTGLILLALLAYCVRFYIKNKIKK